MRTHTCQDTRELTTNSERLKLFSSPADLGRDQAPREGGAARAPQFCPAGGLCPAAPHVTSHSHCLPSDLWRRPASPAQESHVAFPWRDRRVLIKIRQDRHRPFKGKQSPPRGPPWFRGARPTASADAPGSLSAGPPPAAGRWRQGTGSPFLRPLISKSSVQPSPGRRCHTCPKAGDLLAPLLLPRALGHNCHQQGLQPRVGGDRGAAPSPQSRALRTDPNAPVPTGQAAGKARRAGSRPAPAGPW